MAIQKSTPALPLNVRAAILGSVVACGASLMMVSLVAIPLILKMRPLLAIGTIRYSAPAGVLSFVAFCVSFYRLTQAQERRRNSMSEDFVIVEEERPSTLTEEPEIVEVITPTEDKVPKPTPETIVPPPPVQVGSIPVPPNKPIVNDPIETPLPATVATETPPTPSAPPVVVAKPKGKEPEPAREIAGPPPQIDTFQPIITKFKDFSNAFLNAHHKFEKSEVEESDINLINHNIDALYAILKPHLTEGLIQSFYGKIPEGLTEIQTNYNRLNGWGGSGARLVAKKLLTKEMLNTKAHKKFNELFPIHLSKTEERELIAIFSTLIDILFAPITQVSIGENRYSPYEKIKAWKKEIQLKMPKYIPNNMKKNGDAIIGKLDLLIDAFS